MNRRLGALAIPALLLAAPAGAGATTATTAESAAASAPPPRVVSVGGTAQEPIASEADQGSADAAYQQALTEALADGQAKAQLLATDAGATLGAVQEITEQGGYIECPGELEYAGAQPDFPEAEDGYVTSPEPEVAARSTGAVRGTPVKHKVKPHKRARKTHDHAARTAVAASCTLTANVAVSYELG